ncbi:DDE superfamily endonuclease [Popillia japonica]|uniref:DDE superfamily endonuclease n=1 Tax=Popillia japonica TaxID=7064 RepID=A0AAW1L4Z1_POPJA
MSLNIQVVAGPRCEILDIVIRWPGSAHDSRIFNNSAVHMRFEQGLLNGLLLGDSAYQQTMYLFTPVPNPITRAEILYNSAHIRTRNVVERTFGIWKSRFRCLSSCLQYKLQNTTRIIAATAVLHNIAISEREANVDEVYVDQVVPMPPAVADQVRGNAIRAAFINRHFNVHVV